MSVSLLLLLPVSLPVILPVGSEVLILNSGCSDHPWDGEVKAMEAVFDRFIRVPKMIYGTRRLLFRHFIEQHGAEIEETELSALTIIADKYSVNDIKTVCRRVLTSHRVKRNKVSHLWIFFFLRREVFSGNHPSGGV